MYEGAAAAYASLAQHLEDLYPAASPVKFFLGDAPTMVDTVVYPHLLYHMRAPVAAPELHSEVVPRPPPPPPSPTHTHCPVCALCTVAMHCRVLLDVCLADPPMKLHPDYPHDLSRLERKQSVANKLRHAMQ